MCKYIFGKLVFFVAVLFFIVAQADDCAAIAAKSEPPVKVFLLGGQSNMRGVGDASELKPPYSESLSKVKIWNNTSKEWTALQPKGSFGPEISFGHALAKTFSGQDIRLVKHSAGGTALYNAWSPKIKGNQYVQFLNASRAALAELDGAAVNYEIAGMLWLQGESDAKENQGDAYEKNLVDFIAHIRMEFKREKMPFIIARVRNYYGGKTGQAKIVRDA